MKIPIEEELSFLAKYGKRRKPLCELSEREICEFAFALDNPEVDSFEIDYAS